MAKRSRSVLHAYVLPHAAHSRDGRRRSRDVSPRPMCEGGPQPLSSVPVADDLDGLTSRSSSTGGAAFGVTDRSCGASSLNSCYVDMAHDPRCHVEDRCPGAMKLKKGDLDAMEGFDGPFIPVADRLAGLPPSCRTVQSEPNWLERALMLSRCSRRCLSSPGVKGSGNPWNVTAPPDPSCLHPNGAVGEEERRVAALASITAAFYSSLRCVAPAV